MKITLKILHLIFALLLISGCADDNYHNSPTVKRTLIFYMLPGNLDWEMTKNISDVKKSFDGEGEILVYKDALSQVPTLTRLVYDKSKNIWEEKVVNTYPMYDEQGHIPDNMNHILKEICMSYPAESYGLILSSHGTGWKPIDKIQSRSFGPTMRQQMSIEELAFGIPDNQFDFILFDACFMANCEVAYQLRDKASWLIASTAEIPGNGLPYDKLINTIMKARSSSDYSKICDVYVENYENGMGGTLSLIDLHKITDFHSSFCSFLLQYPIISPDLYRSIQDFGDDRTSCRYLFFDIYHFMELLSDQQVNNEYEESFKKCVVYFRSSKQFNAGTIIDLSNNHGLSFYLPNSMRQQYHEDYKALDWAKELEWKNLLN